MADRNDPLGLFQQNPDPLGLFTKDAAGAKPKRGALGEIGNQLKAGVLSDLPEMAGNAIKYASDPGKSVYKIGQGIADFGTEQGKRADLQASPEDHNIVTNTLASGARMIPQSLAPAAAIGAGLALLPEAAIGGTAALALSALGGAVPMGMSQAQNTLEKGREKGIPEADAIAAARRTGLIESAGETAGTFAGGKLLGIGAKIAQGIGGKAAESTLANLTNPGVLKPFAKQLPKTMATEVGTEMGQNAGEAAVEQNYGIDNQTPYDAAVQAIGPTIGMTALLAPFGLAGFANNARASRAKTEALSSQTTDAATRKQIADQFTAELTKVDPNSATQFAANTSNAIANGQPIAVDASLFGKAQPEPAPTAADTGEVTTPSMDQQAASQQTMQRDLEIQRTMAAYNAEPDLVETAKSQLGDGTIGRAASSGIDSGAISPEQVLGMPAVDISGLAPEQQAAADYLSVIDAGGIPLNVLKTNSIARDLGLEVNARSKPEETVQRIRDAASRFTQGADNGATQPDIAAGPLPQTAMETAPVLDQATPAAVSPLTANKSEDITGAIAQNGAINGTADATTTAMAPAGGEVRSDNGVQGVPDALVQPAGRGVGDVAAGSGTGGRIDLPARPADGNETVTPVGFNDIRPPKEDINKAASALSNSTKVLGNDTVPIDTLKGGVSREVGDNKRVDALVKQLTGDNPYLERLIVDDAGNVIEGQHRLEALRKIGVKQVPVVVIKDYTRDFQFTKVVNAIRGAQKISSDNANQLASHLAEIFSDENGNLAEVAKYDAPKGFEKAWKAGIAAASGTAAPVQNEPAATHEAQVPQPAQVGQETANAAPHAVIARVGTTPNSAAPVTVRNGVVHIGDKATDITIPEGATVEQVADALRTGNAVSGDQRIYVGAKGMLQSKAPAKPTQPERRADHEAEKLLGQHKSERETQGQRAALGEIPPNAAIGSPRGEDQPGNAAAETEQVAPAVQAEPSVSANTVFTEDAAAAARALLKRKLSGQLNSGIDPEVMQAGITLAGYHIEKGARSFAAYAKAMISDLGDSVKPYLKSWYAAISLDPRAAGFDGLDSLADVESADVDAPVKAESAPQKGFVKLGDNPDGSEIWGDAAGSRQRRNDGLVTGEMTRAGGEDKAPSDDRYKTSRELSQDDQKPQKAGTVSIPGAIGDALQYTMQRQKDKIRRTGNKLNKPMSLAEKIAIQDEVRQLESDLRKMRTSIFDAEDAIAEAIKRGDVEPFKAFAELFPRAASVLGEHIKDAIEIKQPTTLDELIGAVDAGYKAHFDYAGTDGRTVWIEKKDNGWVMKSRDDGSDATITKGGAGVKGGWAKYEALDNIESDGKHRFTEWKPLVDTTDVQDNAPQVKDDNLPANTLSASLYEAIKAGNMPKDNHALRKLVELFDGKPADTHRMKAAQESLEAAIVMTARDVVGKKDGDQSIFDALLRLYQIQPNLNIRTSTSIANQAYSTPAPLAFLASRLAGINQSSVVYEPTAGTGMLLIGADPAKAIVNELNDLRVGILTEQGFKPTQLDASTETLHHGKPIDVVITNPPFGSVKDASGNPIKVKIDNYNIGQIDHLIAARALADMKDDGRAVLILGANKVSGGMSTDDRIFFNWLYAHYNVTGHFEVNGDLYSRQGAGWPVRVIVIAGREKSNKVSPIAGTIQRADTWSQVYDNYKQILDSSGQHDSAAGARLGSSDTIKAGSGSVRADSGTKVPAVDRPVSTGGQGSDGNVAGTSAGVVPDSANTAAGQVGAGDDGQRLFGQPSEPSGLGTTRKSAKPSNSESAQPAGATTLAEGNEFQVPYTPRSTRKDEGVLIPSNMAQPTQDALSALEDAVGDIDEFAAKELGYKSVDELHQALMGLQVDSVATAIHQIKQGKAVVIADQTGIGKGRQAAAIIRWAAKNGMTPVFVSVKPSLFTDMYGDLADIGTHDIRPFIMNVDASIAHEDGSKLFANKAGVHKALIRRIADSGALPGDSNALFMTYSQINVTNVQREAMMALAPNAVFILDESHNAAGDSATGQFVIGALGMAKGVTYLSATYAKRPDNMPLYFKTDIGDAAADADGLALAMASGGLPLQTVVSHNLVKAGQMFRRERSYDGVSIASKYDTPNRAKHEGMSNEATTALRAIVAADHKFHSGYIKEANDKASSEGGAVIDNAGNKVSAGVQHTEFSSVVHNFIKQMLLGLKAQTAADEAISSLKRNEKPIIAVENTMGSFLNEYAADNGIAQGDDLGSFDYRTVLSRALARTRVLTEVNQHGDKTKRTIRLDELDPQTRAAYDRAQAVIDKLKLDIPVSPIDWIRAEVIRAGYSVAEITGRNISVDYTDHKKPTLTALDLSEQKDKVNTTRQFNSGKLDALILNVAGSTGISLHASERFADQRQRHMIVAQAAGDINIFMQMLGRVHRTGQVTLPKYTILSVDLPTEKRPTAVLSGKMKSLNANTSSNTESATSVESLDIFNKYGDQVVNQYLADNMALARAMDIDREISLLDTEVTDDIARKATGRLALQPIETQHNFYDDVESQYHALIEYLNKTNQNDLVPRTFDFDAKEMRQEVLFDGPNKASPFGEDAIYGEYSIKAQGVPMKPAEISAAMDANLDGKTSEQHAESLIDTLLTDWATEFNANRAKHGLVPGAFDEDKYLSYLQSVYSEDVALSMTENAKQAIAAGRSGEDVPKEVLANNADAESGIHFIRTHRIGDIFRVDINDEPYNAIITNLKSTHKKAGNPFSKSKIQLTVSVNGALRSLSVPATQFQKIEVSSISNSYGIDRLFKEQPPNQRETAKIITGNLLAAYGELQGARGTIITFTKEDGTSEQGILLPKLFDYTKNTRGDYRLPTAAAALKFLQQSNDQNIGRFGIMTRDSVVRVLPEGRGVKVQVPRSKLKGAKYFLDNGLIAAAGDFASSGSFMVATVRNPTDAAKVLDLLMKKQALYALPSMAEEAKALTVDKGDTAFSRDTPNAITPAEAIKRVARVQAIVSGIKSKWKNAPEIIVVANMQDAKVPQRVRDMDAEMKSNGASGEPRGFISAGKVYIVAGQHKSVADVITTVAHEVLGHSGLRGLYKESLKPILRQIVNMRRAEVNAKVKEYGFDPKSERDLLRAAEEVLANLAQTQPEMGFVKRAIAAIRNWLRNNVPGFSNLKLTDNDIIQQFILPARAFVERGVKMDGMGSMSTAYSRSSEQGKGPARGTVKEAEAAGYTLRAYRGVSAASPFNGSGTAWFTTSRDAAESYAKEVFGYDDPTVIEVRIKSGDLKAWDMRKIGEEERDMLSPDEFGNPQDIGIYRNSDDSMLGGNGAGTVIHAPVDSVMVVDDGGVAFSRTNQTETDTFKKWFGDSKVVDENGNPRIVGGAYIRSDFNLGNIGPLGKKAYSEGKAQRDSGYSFSFNEAKKPYWIYEESNGDVGTIAYLHAMLAAGVKGLPLPEPVVAMRRGALPREGISRNFRDQINEGGVSTSHILKNGKWVDSSDGTYAMFNVSGDTHYIVGFPVSHRSGSDGEVLLVGAIDLGKVKDDNVRVAGNDDVMFSRVVGDSGRTYTPEQRAAMGRTGSTITDRAPKDVVKSLWQDAGKKLAQGLVDQFRPVRDLSDHAYTLMRLSNGATGAFEAFMQHGKLTLRDGAYDADTTGGVLNNVFFPLGKESTDFLRWVAGNRAERLLGEGKENLFTPDDIAAFKSLADGETDFDYTLSDGSKTRDRAAIYMDSLVKFNEFNKNVLDMAEQSGMIDGDSRKFWEHEFYVPFYRAADEVDGGVRGMNIKSGVVRQQAFKKLKGGEQQLNDLLENTLMNWAHLIDASSKNRAATATLEAAEKLGVARRAMPGEKKTVWVMKDGQKVEYKIEDPYLMEAVNSLEYAGLRGPVMDAMSSVKHWLTVGVTASPFFKVRNLIRDSVQAIATSNLGYNPLANVKKGYKLTNRASQEYVSALAGGGLIRFGTMMEGSEVKRTRQLIKIGKKESSILDSESKMRAFYESIIEPAIVIYNEIGNRGEEINRMSLYDTLIKQGKDHATASLMARDLMDFSMRGTWTSIRFLTQVVPFMNARLQGMYKLGRASKEDPARMAITLGAVSIASLALLAAYGGDDDWKKREDWDRDNYWWFKIGGEAFRIPKPFEIGAIATLAERSAELLFDNEMTGKRFKATLVNNISNQLAMNPTPQLFKPIIDLYANNDSYTGRPIETHGMENVDSEYRFRASTSMVARGVSTAGNTVTGGNFASPVQIDHLLRAYFGWLGTFSVSMADTMIRSVSSEPVGPTSDYMKNATGGIIAGLDGARSRYVSQMYEQAREIEQAYGTYRSLIKQGKQDEAIEYRDNNIDALRKYKYVEFVKRQSARINERIRQIERSDASGDEKRLLINDLRDRQDAIAQRLSAG